MKFFVYKKRVIKKKKNSYLSILFLKKRIKYPFFHNKNLLHAKKNDCFKFAYFFEDSFYKINEKKIGTEILFPEIFGGKKKFLEIKWRKKSQVMNFFRDSVKILFQKIFSLKFIRFYPKKKYVNLNEDRKENRKEIFSKINKSSFLDGKEKWVKKEKINKKIIEILLKFFIYSTKSDSKSPTLFKLIFPLILL